MSSVSDQLQEKWVTSSVERDIKYLFSLWTKGSCSVWPSFVFPGEEYTTDPFQWDFVGKNIAFMAVEGFVYFILNLLIQYRFFLEHW